MHIKRYLQLAQLNGRLNDAAVMSRLNVTRSQLAAFRSGAALPAEETAIRIGEIAGAPPELMLRELAQWRARPGRSRRLSAAAVPLAGDD